MFSIDLAGDLGNGTCIFQFPESLSVFQPFTGKSRKCSSKYFIFCLGFVNPERSDFALQKYAVTFPLLPSAESKTIESIGTGYTLNMI